MSEKFTKGPWKWATSNSWRRLFSYADESKPVHVLVPVIRVGGHSDTQINEYDMALIAAAPDMYGALGNLIETIERVDPGVYDLSDARAALEKAEP